MKNRDKSISLKPALQSARRGPTGRRLVSALLTGACIPLLGFLAPAANAQTSPKSNSQNHQEQAVEKVYFEADNVTRETEDSPIIATGNVKAYFGERYLEADRVSYNPTTDIVTASGNVSITDAEGQTFFADDVALDGELNDGIASNFGVLLFDDSRLAGSSVIKSGDGRNELKRATYSACDVCKENGDEKTPTWQVRAGRVVQDPDMSVIRFNDAILEVLGVPIFYSPFLQIPDPTVERQSGFLTPKIGSSTLLGAYAEIPYYFAISSYQDATFSPKFMTDQGTLLQGEYRLRRQGGLFAIQGGIIGSDGTEELSISGTNLSFDVPEIRYHLFAKGIQSFANSWLASFDINHVSDNRYLRSYDVEPEGDLRRDRGLYRPDRLRSTISLARLTDTSILTIDGIGFNSLRTTENNDLSGQTLPRVHFSSEYKTPIIGGITTIEGNLLSLWRRDGLNSNRAIASVSWEKSHTTKGGHRFRGFTELRGDVYQYNDIFRGNELCNDSMSAVDYAACLLALPGGGLKNSTTTSRFLPTAGIEWSYPLAKRTSNALFVIEPKIQLVASPDNDFSEQVLNEDSQFFEFDAATLYDWSKGSGYDVWEDGQRINIGISGNAKFDNGFTLKGLIGQQFRASETQAFVTSANLTPGIDRTSSDIVGNLGVRWSNNISLNSRFRIDSRDGTLRNNETNVRGRYGPVSGSLSYLKILAGDQASIDSQTDEYLTTNLTYKLTDQWNLGGRWQRDLGLNQTTTETFSLGYSDECTIVSLEYRNDRTRNQGFDFDRSITIRLELRGFNG
jgi:LPS-assembly protein